MLDEIVICLQSCLFELVFLLSVLPLLGIYDYNVQTTGFIDKNNINAVINVLQASIINISLTGIERYIITLLMYMIKLIQLENFFSLWLKSLPFLLYTLLNAEEK